MDETQARARIGESVDRYVLEELLGTGGFGAVYRARHAHMGRSVALKVLHPHPPPTPEMQERFLREARAAAAIDEPGIVHVYDCGVTPGGEAFLAMELLEGEDLAEHLSGRGPLPMGRAVELARAVLRPLGAAHAAGVVHRDLKPANVFLAGGGVKLLDFGISKLEGDGVAPLTKTGVVMGTPHYMAPETFRGAATVDHRADLYAVGAMLFEMLAGRPPHDAETYERLVVKVATQPAPALSSVVPSVPAVLGQVVDRALASDPEARFGSAAELAAALAPFVGPAAELGTARTEAVPAVASGGAAGWGGGAPSGPALPETRWGTSPGEGAGPSSSRGLGTGGSGAPAPAAAAPTPVTHPSAGEGARPGTGSRSRLAIGVGVALVLGLATAVAVPLLLDAASSGKAAKQTSAVQPQGPSGSPGSAPEPVAPPVAPVAPTAPAGSVEPPPAAPAPSAAPPPPPPSASPVASSGAIRIGEPRIVGGLNAGTVRTAAQQKRGELGRCRGSAPADVTVQLLVSAGGRIAIAQPDPTGDPGPAEAARCAANVLRTIGRLPGGTGQGIAFVPVHLPGR